MSSKRLTNFDNLVEHFISTDELGHYNKDNFSICLYGIENNPAAIKEIRKAVSQVTTRFKLIVLEPGDQRTNINILDIDL